MNEIEDTHQIAQSGCEDLICNCDLCLFIDVAGKNALGKLEGSGGGVGATDSAPRLRAKSSSASSGFDTQGHARGYNKNMIRLKNLYECERSVQAQKNREKKTCRIHRRQHQIYPDTSPE